ncbi:MAG: ABC transporter ATP-binding protein [Halobacteriovorax sp.]|nr:ABC transporter ATP-binding protein [Halobacteriovorax sp.]
MSTILEIKDLNVHYGAIHAIHGINLKVEEGEIVTLIGSNGAGKTTTLHTISGLLKPTSGEIVFKGQPIQGLPAHKIVAQGLAQTPEGRMVFPDLTVGENLEMGAFLRNNKAEIAADLKKMFTLFPRLEERRKQHAGTLSGGEQQMLAIARAYMAKPKLLLLDEPSLGIAPILVQAIFDAIVEINRSGMTVLLVEQNAYAALKIAHRGYVLTTGEIAMQGPSAELISNEEIRKAYLGH